MVVRPMRSTVLRVRLANGRTRRATCRCQPGRANVEDKAAADTAEHVSKEKIPSDPDDVAKKYGLEAGLFQAFSNKGTQGVSAKELLQRYGGAYLITSISLAAITFTLCYIGVDSGVDVPALLARIGISVSADSAQERAGTLALAYAAHKALSPVRFPPTVILTPLLADLLAKNNPKAPE